MPDPGLALGDGILAGSASQLAEVIDVLAEAVTVRDRDRRFAYANRAALRILGIADSGELLGRPLSVVLDRFILRDERGRPVPPDAIPSARLLETGLTPPPLLVQVIERGSGVGRWLRLKCEPLRDEAGRVSAAVTVIEDMTAAKTAEIHTRVLAESVRELSASLDYEQTLENVARAALPDLADWCLVELVDGDVREQVVVAHVDHDQRSLAARLRAVEGPHPSSESALRRVIASGEPELHPEISDSHLRRVSISDAQLEIFRALSIHSAIVVPMRNATRIIGAMSFFTSGSRRRFTAEDLGIAEQLARQAAVAVENARLHTLLVGVSETLQSSLLPSPVPQVAGWEIGTLYRPAPGAIRIDVGGDFYEVFDTDSNAFATIGDVTGHGVHAATVTALLRHGARFASHLEPEPVAIIRRLDEELRRRADPMMASALCAALHDHSLLVCSAGHPPALLIAAEGTATEAPSSGPLLGAFPDSIWHQERVPVSDGDTVLLYTDGVTETAGPQGRFGTDRLREFASYHAGSAPQALLDALAAELERFRGGPATDDVAALALRPRAR